MSHFVKVTISILVGGGGEKEIVMKHPDAVLIYTSSYYSVLTFI
jgi:hypothetical protein